MTDDDSRYGKIHADGSRSGGQPPAAMQTDDDDKLVDEFEARLCPDMPTACCDYGVISHKRGVEICRVWTEEDARLIADLLNHAHTPKANSTAIAISLKRIADTLQALSGPLNAYGETIGECIQGQHERGLRGIPNP